MMVAQDPEPNNVSTVAYLGPGGAPPPATPSAAIPDPAGDADETLDAPEALRVRRTTLGRGGTLAAALGRVGVPEELRPAIQRAVGRHLDPRRLPAKMGISATRGSDGRLLAVSFRAELERYLRVTVSGPATALAPRSMACGTNRSPSVL